MPERLLILPDRFGWPTAATEYAPGRVGLDFAVGHEVTVHDWFLGAVTGRLDACDFANGAARSMRVALVLADGARYWLPLTYASEIEVHA